MQNRLTTSLAIAGAILGVGSPLAASAAPSEPAPAVTHLDVNLTDAVDRGDVSPTLQDAQYLWGGRNYCWYPGGWRGPGYYWCGYAWRRGFGWGGPIGWHGWGGHGWHGGGWHGGGWHGGHGGGGWHGGHGAHGRR
ncbi:MAG: hypothetical protein WDM85_10990 [Caulobacteraceae bacterium]